jgi:hypothetical protein
LIPSGFKGFCGDGAEAGAGVGAPLTRAGIVYLDFGERATGNVDE